MFLSMSDKTLGPHMLAQLQHSSSSNQQLIISDSTPSAVVVLKANNYYINCLSMQIMNILKTPDRQSWLTRSLADTWVESSSHWAYVAHAADISALISYLTHRDCHRHHHQHQQCQDPHNQCHHPSQNYYSTVELFCSITVLVTSLSDSSWYSILNINARWT